jgi:hypothetical protein
MFQSRQDHSEYSRQPRKYYRDREYESRHQPTRDDGPDDRSVRQTVIPPAPHGEQQFGGGLSWGSRVVLGVGLEGVT